MLTKAALRQAMRVVEKYHANMRGLQDDPFAEHYGISSEIAAGMAARCREQLGNLGWGAREYNSAITSKYGQAYVLQTELYAPELDYSR